MGAVALLGSLLTFAAHPTGATERGRLVGAPADSTLRVEIRDDRLSLEVRNQSWARLARELNRATGIVFRLDPAPAGSVTASFKHVPIEHILQHLAGADAGIVFFYDSVSAALPSEVWIQGDSRADARPVAAGEVRGVAHSIVPSLRDPDPAARTRAIAAMAGAANDSVVEPLAWVIGEDVDLVLLPGGAR